MSSLVLGGNGLIGSAVRDTLLRAGRSVVTFGRNASPGSALSTGGQLEHVRGDFSSFTQWGPLLRDCEVVYHCISTTTPHSADLNPSFDLETNCAAFVRFLSVAALVRSRVVFVSSAGTVYGPTRERIIEETHPTEPVCAYGVGKLAMEKYLHFFSHRHELKYAIARVANAFGENQNLANGQGAIGVFLRKTLAGDPIEIWGTGEVVRDYVYAEDVAEALVRLATYDGQTPVFNVGTGRGQSLNQIVSAIEQALGRPVARTNWAARPEDVPYNVLSVEKARAVLGWQASTPFDTALNRTIRWLQRPADSSPAKMESIFSGSSLERGTAAESL